MLCVKTVCLDNTIFIIKGKGEQMPAPQPMAQSMQRDPIQECLSRCVKNTMFV